MIFWYKFFVRRIDGLTKTTLHEAAHMVSADGVFKKGVRMGEDDPEPK